MFNGSILTKKPLGIALSRASPRPTLQMAPDASQAVDVSQVDANGATIRALQRPAEHADLRDDSLRSGGASRPDLEAHFERLK